MCKLVWKFILLTDPSIKIGFGRGACRDELPFWRQAVLLGGCVTIIVDATNILNIQFTLVVQLVGGYSAASWLLVI
jgi:hypothetical protein